jgi:tRNA (cytidine/uridine-2'-O-)-methyltransferase
MTYARSDYVVLGSESVGTPRALYAQMDATLRIPMREGLRSLNVAMSAGMLVAEACRFSRRSTTRWSNTPPRAT